MRAPLLKGIQCSPARPRPPRARAAPSLLITGDYRAEPLLLFAEDGLHVDPKAGIARYGPRSLTSVGRHPGRLRVGFIGRPGQIDAARRWLARQAEGVNGNAKNPEFPGWAPDRGFFSQLEFAGSWDEQPGQAELRRVLEIRSQKDRLDSLLQLLDAKLRMLAERDNPPGYILIAMSDDIVSRCGTADYTSRETGAVHGDLRRAESDRDEVPHPTQILQQAITDGRDRTPPARIASNFFTGMYCKAGGYPWSPHGLTPGTCYVGIGFHCPLGSGLRTMQTSLIQAFDGHGEGLVLRGHDFDWDPDKTGSRSPHPTADDAGSLMTRVLDQYEQQMHQTRPGSSCTRPHGTGPASAMACAAPSSHACTATT